MNPARIFILKPNEDCGVTSKQCTPQLNTPLLEWLQQTYPETCGVVPVLALGDMMQGKRRVLDQLLSHLAEQRNEVLVRNSTFEDMQQESCALDLWPQLIPWGGKDLLFMRLAGVDYAHLDDVTQKSILAALSVASVVLFFSENTTLFKLLETTTRAAEMLDRDCKLGPTKWVVFAEKEGVFERVPNLLTGLCNLLSRPDSNRFEFVFRGRGDLSTDMCQDIAKKLLTCDSFAERNQSLRNQPFFASFAAVLGTVCNLAEMYGCYGELVEMMPQFENAMKDVSEMKIYAQQVNELVHAETLPLFTGNALKSMQQLAHIQSTFDSQRPTVALLMLGQRNMGKSSFLDVIVQFVMKLKQEVRLFTAQQESTSGSLMLSKPIIIPESDNQLVLIDQEGLMGAEMSAPGNLLRQCSLISKTIVLASVPCVLVTNDISKIAFAEQMVERIAVVNEEAGMLVERVCLLIYDKDYSGLGKVEFFTDFAQRLNFRYFSGREVVIVMLKPSMVASGKEEQRKRFMCDFMRVCDKPKKGASGAFVDFASALAAASASHSHFPLCSPKEFKSVQELLERGKKSLRKCYDEITVPAHAEVSIVTLFNERYRAIVAEFCLSLASEREDMLNFAVGDLSAAADQLRLHLLYCESFFDIIRNASLNLVFNLKCAINDGEYSSDRHNKLNSAYEKYQELENMEQNGAYEKKLLVATMRAMELYESASVLSGKKKFNEGFLRYISPLPTSTLVLIGTLDSSVKEFANELVHLLLPLTSSSFSAFAGAETVQALPLQHYAYHAGRRVLAQLVLVVVQIPVAREREMERALIYAWALLARAAVSCVFVDLENPRQECLETILEAAVDAEGSPLVAQKKQKTMAIFSGVKDAAGLKKAQGFVERRLLPELITVRSVRREHAYKALHALRRVVQRAELKSNVHILGDLVQVNDTAFGNQTKR